MKVMQVHYERLRSFGNYENETIGVYVTVDPSEEADEALRYARAWVEEKISVAARAEKESLRAWQIRAEVADLEQRLERAKRQWEKASAFLAAHGLNVVEDDIPF